MYEPQDMQDKSFFLGDLVLAVTLSGSEIGEIPSAFLFLR